MPPETMTAILSVCGGVITIDKVIDIIAKYHNKGKAPTEDLRQQVAELREQVAELKATIVTIVNTLDREKKRVDQSEKSASVTQRAILALIDNALDSSNKSQLLDAKKDLDAYLTERTYGE